VDTVSLHAFRRSRALTDEDFDVLLFALLRRADSLNYRKIASVYPMEAQEIEARYVSPGGILTVERRELEGFEE
jgi:hypothetical protein